MAATEPTTGATTVVTDLVRLLDDTCRGFSEAADRLGRDGYPDIAARFEDFAEQRAWLSEELRTVATGSGIPVADDVSAGTDWIDLTDAHGDEADDANDAAEAVLRAAERSEDLTIEAFDRALSYGDVPPELQPTVRRQAAEIRSARNEVAAFLE